MNEVQHREHRYTFANPRREHMHGEEVLFANDREPDETQDAWKYKVIAPNSTWSVGFDTWGECYRTASADTLRDA